MTDIFTLIKKLDIDIVDYLNLPCSLPEPVKLLICLRIKATKSIK